MSTTKMVANQSSCARYNKPLTLDKVVDCIFDLSKYIQSIQKIGCVHQQVNLDNISYVNGKYRLIKQNFVVTQNEFYTPRNMALANGDASYPPEYRIVSKSKNKGISYEKQLLASYLGLKQSVIGNIMDNKMYVLSYEYLMYSCQGDNPLKYLKEFQSHTKADVYSLGVCFIEMLLSLNSKIDIQEDLFDEVLRLITRMLLPHPENRIGIDKLVETIQAIHYKVQQ